MKTLKTQYLYSFTLMLVACMLGMLGVFGLFAGGAAGAAELANVNGKSITLEEFNKKYHDNLKYFQFKTPTQKDVLDDIIKRELGIQEAKKQKLDKDPDVIDRINTVLYQSLLEKQLGKKFEGIHITDEQAKEYYVKNPEIRTSHIFVALKLDASQQDQSKAYEKIKKIYDEELKGGKVGFAEVAQRFSEGVAAPMGGDIDFQTRDKLDPAYYDAALKLKTPGLVTSIIRTQFGYHIIKLTAMRSWEETDHAQVKRQVFDEQRQHIFEQFMKTLRDKAKVTVNSELLNK